MIPVSDFCSVSTSLKTSFTWASCWGFQPEVCKDTSTPVYCGFKCNVPVFRVKSCSKWRQQWLSAGIRFLVAGNEKNDPACSRLQSFLLCFVLLSAEMSAPVWERDMRRLCCCICVCAFYYCSHWVAYTALFPPVLILCFTCLILNRITHSIHLLPRASVWFFVFQYLCPTVLFFPVQERQWTNLSDVLVRTQTTQWKQTVLRVCVCVWESGCVRGHVGVCVVSVSSEQSGFNDCGTRFSL